MQVALATCAERPNGDDEAAPLIAALAERGVVGESAVWDDHAVNWDRFDLVVIRSTWDYTRRRDAFLRWAESLPHVLNPPDVLRWNTDKRYLERLGSHAVPTEFIEPGAEFTVPTEPYVIKPSVGAGSIGAAAYDAGDERGRAHVTALHGAGQTVVVQPYVAKVETLGETALIYFGDRFSHAVRKAAILAPGVGPPGAGLYVEEKLEPAEPLNEQLELAERVFETIPFARGDLLYARIDLLPGPLVLEVEVTEPSLFIGYAEGAPARFAKAIAAAASQRRRISPEKGPMTSQ